MKTRVLLSGLVLLLVLAACDFGVNVDSFDEAESILQIEATQADEIFTFTVSISEEDYNSITADPEFGGIQEVFLWIKPNFGYDWSSYNPLQRQEVTLEELLIGVSVTVDFAEIANDQNRWWLNAFQLSDDEFNERLESFEVIASTGFSRGWRDLEVDGQYTYFENSYPTGAYRSEVFDVELGDGEFDYIVIRQGNPGVSTTASTVADGDIFHVVVQMEADSYLSGTSGSGFDEVNQFPQISYLGSGGATTEELQASSLNSVLTDITASTYVWTFQVDSAAAFLQGGDSSVTPITLDAQADQGIQILAYLSSFWNETIEMYAIGPVTTVASTTFDATVADVNMIGGDITDTSAFGASDGNGPGVYTEELTSPFTVTPSAVDADWNIGLPAIRYDELDEGNRALSSGDGAADATYGTLRNDFVELPISGAVDNWSSSSEVWVFFDVYHDFSDAWDDRFELQYGGFRNGPNNWNFYNAERYSDWGGFTTSGIDQPEDWVRYGDPSVNNGWYQVGFRLGSGGSPPNDNAPIRFRLRSDNFLDGKQGIAIDNVRVVTR